MDAALLSGSQGSGKMDAMNAWDLDSRLENGMDALRCPPADTPVSVVSGENVAALPCAVSYYKILNPFA
jgi:hypothetical protein